MGKTVTTVSASASVNPLSQVEAKKSGIIQYAITASALKIGYTEYRKLDYKQGSTREIQRAHSKGEQTSSNVVFIAMDGNDVTNPLDDYDDQATTRNYSGTPEDLDFMPMLMIKDDDYPEGVIKARDGSPAKKTAETMAKAMNLDLKDMTETLIGTPRIPQLGSEDWAKYSKAYRASGTGGSEAAYRSKLVKDAKDKKKGMKDVTDMSIGYFGRFDKKNTVVGQAMYHTLLACLDHTHQYKPVAAGSPAIPPVGNPGDPGYKPGQPAGPDTDLGTARRFGIHGKLFSAVYSLNGFIHREIPGRVPGNNKGVLGYSKASVHLDSEDPINTTKGVSLYNDYGGGNKPFFDKSGWNGQTGGSKNVVPDMYVSIMVQTSATSYRELVLVDFFQETTIEGKGYTRRSNSGNQSKQEEKMTWKEAYEAEAFIPLTRSSMMKIKMLHRNNLLIESKCHFIQAVNVKKTKKKWYQTGIFKAIMVIIAVVVFVWSGGLAGGVLNAIITIGTGMAISYALNLIIKVLVDLGIISNAFAIALIAVVAVAAMAYGAGIKMDFKLVDVVLKTVEATGQVYAQQMVKETEAYQVKADKLQKEKEKLEEKEEGLDELHTSNGIGVLMADLQRMIDAVTGPMDETRKQFLARTTSRKVVTERLTYRALKAELEIEKKGY